MKNKKKSNPDLRHKAEQLLAQKITSQNQDMAAASTDLEKMEMDHISIDKLSSENMDNLSKKDLLKIAHELQVHQIELQMQNEELRDAQEKISEMKQNYFDLFHFAPIGYLSMTAKGIIRQVNLAFGQLVGQDLVQVQGKHFFRFIIPEEQSKFLQWFQYGLSHNFSGDFKTKNNYEMQLMHGKNPGSWVSISLKYLENSAKEDNIIVSVQDITERFQSRKLLESTLVHLNTAIDVGNLAWWRMDIATGKVDFHEKKVKMLGYPLADFQNQTYHAFTNLIHPEDHEGAMNAMRDHICGQAAAYQVEYRIKASHGKYIWFYDFGRVTEWHNDGKPLAITGIVVDITDRKEAEIALREKEERFRRIFFDSGIGMVLCDLQGKFLQVNEKFCEVTGYTESEIMTKSFEDITHPEDLTIEVPQVEKMIRNEMDSYQLEKRYIHKSKQIIWVLVTVSILRNEHDQPVFFVGQIQDISQIKNAQSQLELAAREAQEASQAKANFLANMSHEIRTPMNGVLGMLNLLKDFSLPHSEAELVDMACNSAEALLTIINDILDFSKIEAGKLHIDAVAFDLHDLMDSIYSFFNFQSKEKNLDFSLDYQLPENVIFLGDANRIRQVLNNLIGNAIKFTEKGSITICLREAKPNEWTDFVDAYSEQAKSMTRFIDKKRGTKSRLFAWKSRTQALVLQKNNCKAFSIILNKLMFRSLANTAVLVLD